MAPQKVQKWAKKLRILVYLRQPSDNQPRTIQILVATPYQVTLIPSRMYMLPKRLRAGTYLATHSWACY